MPDPAFEITMPWNWSSARPICCVNCSSSRASSSGRTRFRSSPTCCSKPTASEVKMLATDLEVGLRSTCHGVGFEGRIADASREEALRNHQGASRDRRADRGRQGGRQGRRGSLRLAHADAAARGFPVAARRRTGSYSATLPRDVLRRWSRRRSSRSPAKTRATS